MTDRAYPNLRTFMDATGITGTELANQLGCSQGFVSMLRSGDRRPSLPWALKIAAHCHIPLESLIPPPRRRMAKAS
jgi:transcriptional regulator with XRE-family HTH domain